MTFTRMKKTNKEAVLKRFLSSKLTKKPPLVLNENQTLHQKTHLHARSLTSGQTCLAGRHSGTAKLKDATLLAQKFPSPKLFTSLSHQSKNPICLFWHSQCQIDNNLLHQMRFKPLKSTAPAHQYPSSTLSNNHQLAKNSFLNKSVSNNIKFPFPSLQGA